MMKHYPPGSPPGIAVDVGILVTDMARSLNFYHDLLELPIVAEVTTSLIGDGKMVQLRHGASLIKLVELDEPPTQGKTHSQQSISAALGYRYITLLVPDLNSIMTKMDQSIITLPITQLGNGTQIAMVADLDGNIVEFVQEVGQPLEPGA